MKMKEAAKCCATAKALKAQAKRAKSDKERISWEAAAESYCALASKHMERCSGADNPGDEKLLIWRLAFWAIWLVIAGFATFAIGDHLESIGPALLDFEASVQ